MEPSGGKEMWEGWSAVSNQLYNNPKASALMSSRAARYLSGHPLAALATLFFCAMAATPVALFLLFAALTAVSSALGFLIFEGFLLFAGAVSLACVLTGVAVLSAVASATAAAIYLAVSNILNYLYYSPRLSKVDKEDGEERTHETE